MAIWPLTKGCGFEAFETNTQLREVYIYITTKLNVGWLSHIDLYIHLFGLFYLECCKVHIYIYIIYTW